MTRHADTSQPAHSMSEIDLALTRRGADLGQLARGMRAFSRDSDASGDIAGPPWRPEDVPALNLSLVPETYGGCAETQPLVAQATLMSWLAEADASLALALPGPGLAMPPVVALASAAQQAQFFHRFRSVTPRWGAFAITEPDCGSDATAMRTTARQTARGWVLNGTKCFITNGARADCVVTFATLNRQMGRYGIRAFLVDRETPGFSVTRIEKMAGLRASQLAMLSFTDCEVPHDAMLARGDEQPLDDAFSGAQRSWDYFRPSFPQSWSVRAAAYAPNSPPGSRRAARPRRPDFASPTLTRSCSTSTARSPPHGSSVIARHGKPTRDLRPPWSRP